jgi:hypothetical protein
MNALEKLAERAPDLAFELPDGTPVVRLGLIATLYFKEGYTLKSKQRVMECFKRFHDELGSRLKGQYFERYKKLTTGSFENIHNSILSSAPNEQYHWHLSSAPNVKEAEDYSLSTLNSFEIHGDKKRSYIKLVMPWTVLCEPNGPERYQEWIVYLCNQVKAEHGYGGLSSILPYDYHSYMPTEYQLAQQFSGLTVDSTVHITARRLLEHIKSVNWYTVLGNSYVERLGGLDAIKQKLSGRGDVEIQSYNNGLLIRAGQYPELGASQDGLPPAYVAVNKVIKPVRLQETGSLHTYSPYGDGFTDESTTLWYARFDQEDNANNTPKRIPAGQPCTHSGYWFTPAQANSRRLFKQGELMLGIGDSNWGDTLWYWSAEG